jgi:Holliday junction DNA helicase RuvA
MISRLKGKVVDAKDNTIIVEVNGLGYEVLVPTSVFQRIDQAKDAGGNITLMTHHYVVMTPSSATPVLVGFLNELEKNFFLHFISVSGIGPRAAVKALNRSIAEIAHAIDQGDAAFLKTLPGIGTQKAKDIMAKLQGKMGRFGLIPDKATRIVSDAGSGALMQEALAVLAQLQYSRPEAAAMIEKAMARRKDISTVEELLNEIYKQRVQN